MNDDILNGIRIDGGSDAPRRSPGAVTYSVIPPAPASPGEKRGGRRQRTRLRSGKILTPANTFLTECLIHDVSVCGARLHLSSAVKVPDVIGLYRDDDATVNAARVVWRKPSWVGIEFTAASPGIRPAALSALGGKYYRVASSKPPR